MGLNVQLHENDDILLFWLQQKSKFPILFSIVQDFYAIPASNTTVERLFSSSKNTITDKRTSLGTEKVNKLLFLQKNLTLLKKFDEKTTDEAAATETKRKMAEQPSSTVSFRNQEQLIATTVTKKLKTAKEDDIVFCSDDSEEDKENDEIDLF